MKPEDLAALSPAERRELLRRLTSGELLVPDAAARFEPFPLTDIQQAYLLGRTPGFALGGVACQFFYEFDITGKDPERLEAAWMAMVRRHDQLRLVVTPDGQQRALPEPLPWRLPIADLSAATPDAAEAFRDATWEEVSRDLPLDRGMPWELRAVRLPGERLHLFIHMDLMVVDFDSVLRMFDELRRRYEGEQVPDAPPAVAFRDYVLAWQRLVSSPLARRAQRYWDERTASLPPGPALPFACDPVSLGRPRYARLSGALDVERSARLLRHAQDLRLTPSAILCTAYAEALGTWSRGRDFTLVLTLAHRHPFHPAIGDLLGDFTSTVLLGLDRSGPTFAARAESLMRRLAEDLDHLHVSGVRVLREYKRRNDPGWSATFPVVFTSGLGHRASAGQEPFAWLGPTVRSLSSTPQVALDHQVIVDQGRLLYHWDHVPDLFPPGMMREMFAAYEALLERLADEGAAGATLVPGDHRARVAAINATETSKASGSLAEPVWRAVQAEPGRLAIVQGSNRLTYGELWAGASGIARALLARVAGPGARVAVVIDKSPLQIMAVLGALLAGAAYLPVATDLPPARIARLLEHGQVHVSLTTASLLGSLPASPGVEYLAVDRVPPMDWLAPPAPPGDLAYIIYTSGSTGEPKGVMIDHQSALNTIVDVNQRFGICPEDCVLGISSLSFDLSVWDIFGALGAGARLVLPPAGAGRDPEAWRRCLVEERVTVWNSVPALLEMFLEHCRGRETGDAMRLIMLSGDWIGLPLPDAARARFRGAKVYSLGGATEASIWSICYPIGAVDPAWPSIPYGRPMANQRFYVLDEALQIRPAWVPGELYIGGSGLALGYWRDPARTAERFLHHPETGERLYRTGDLGRYLPDGDIEFLGREDLQVKVGGYRIELGEIEAALAQHPRVRAVAVAAPQKSCRARRLVACVVPEVDGPDLFAVLEQDLASRLPAWMVPRVWVRLDQLPLTANGKLDRAHLPTGPAVVELSPDELPETPTEEAVLAIYREVLGVERLSVRYNFFELGATSLQVVEACRKIAAGPCPAVTIVDMFAHPSIRAISAWIDRRQEAGDPELDAVHQKAAQRRVNRRIHRAAPQED